MKYIKLFENFDSYDPYELMMVSPNRKAEMIIQEIKSNVPNLNLVSDLIVLGANLDWQGEDNDGYTPLHFATEYGEDEIVKMLIDAGADVNVQSDWNGSTPLYWAAKYKRLGIVKILIDAKAYLDVQDVWGNTPLHMATVNGYIEVVRMLVEAGAKIDIPNNRGETPYDYAETKELKNLLQS
jgi:serine/threonine-protein phosphatase 6 regulatory ankyrin repeat subunit B